MTRLRGKHSTLRIHRSSRRFYEHGQSAHPQHDVQARQPASQPQQIPVNEAEWILREMFDCAGLDGYQP
jgi:hypothetical protein